MCAACHLFRDTVVASDDEGHFLTAFALPLLNLACQIERTPLAPLNIKQNSESIRTERAYDAPALFFDAFPCVMRRTFAQFRDFRAHKAPESRQIILNE